MILQIVLIAIAIAITNYCSFGLFEKVFCEKKLQNIFCGFFFFFLIIFLRFNDVAVIFSLFLKMGFEK